MLIISTDGIHIMSVLNERRRMVTLGHSYEVQMQGQKEFVVLVGHVLNTYSTCYLHIFQQLKHALFLL